MNAEDATNDPCAEPPSPTVSRTIPCPPYAGPHGATMTAPGRDCSTHAYGTVAIEQVAITRSYAVGVPPRSTWPSDVMRAS